MMARHFSEVMHVDRARSIIVEGLEQATLLQLCLTTRCTYDLVAPIAYECLTFETGSHFESLIRLLEYMLSLGEDGKVPENDKDLLGFSRTISTLCQTRIVVFRLNPAAREFRSEQGPNQYRNDSALSDDLNSSHSPNLHALSEDSSSGGLGGLTEINDAGSNISLAATVSDQDQAWDAQESGRLSHASEVEDGLSQAGAPDREWEDVLRARYVLEENVDAHSLDAEVRYANMGWQERFAIWREDREERIRRSTPEFLRTASDDLFADIGRALSWEGSVLTASSIGSWPSASASTSESSASMALSARFSEDELFEDADTASNMTGLAEHFRTVVHRISEVYALWQRQQRNPEDTKCNSTMETPRDLQHSSKATGSAGHSTTTSRSRPNGLQRDRSRLGVPFSSAEELWIEPLHYPARGPEDLVHQIRLPAAFPSVISLRLGIDSRDEMHSVWSANLAEMAKVAPNVENLDFVFLPWSIVDHHTCSHLAGLPVVDLRHFRFLRVLRVDLDAGYKGRIPGANQYEYSLHYGQRWGALAFDMLVRVLLDGAVACRDGCSELTDTCTLYRLFKTLSVHLPPREMIQWHDSIEGYIRQVNNDQQELYGRVAVKIRVKYRVQD